MLRPTLAIQASSPLKIGVSKKACLDPEKKNRVFTLNSASQAQVGAYDQDIPSVLYLINVYFCLKGKIRSSSKDGITVTLGKKK